MNNTCNYIVKLFLASAIIILLSSCQSAPKKTSNNSTATGTTNGVFDDLQKATYQVALEALNDKSYSKAESLLISLTKERPDIAGPWANLGLINLIQQQPEKAKQNIKKALTLSPKMPEALNIMGLLATHNRQVIAAVDFYQAAIESKPNYANAHYNLALLYDIYLQDIKLAAQHYRLYLKFIKHEDKETQDWVDQLEASL